MIKLRKFFLYLLTLISLFHFETTQALESNVVRKNHTSVSLISEHSALSKDSKELKLGIRFRLDPQWHIYWQNPGDSGTPPKVKWEANLKSEFGGFLWPLPQPIPLPPLLNYGYEGEVIFPLKVSILDYSAASLKVRARLSWLECKVECIPGKADLELEIPIRETAKFSDESNLIYKALSKVPQVKSDVKISVEEEENDIVIKAKSENLVLGSFDNYYFFPFNGSLISHSSSQKIEKNDNAVRLFIKKHESLSVIPNIVDGVLLLQRNGEPPISFEVKSDKKFFKMNFSYLLILFFAFVGGTILNLMPCVFPVISIKILSFVEASRETGTKLSKHGWAYTTGVVLSFLILSGILLALRGLGQNLGWGFQLQSPYFIFFMIILFFLMGLNLLGVYEIGENFANINSSRTRGKDLKSSFFTGVLATLVATPCTAPFMGTALGVAITLPALQALMVFLFVGLGMSAPYLLLTYFPVALRILPKPGLWMKKFKEILSYPMFATVLWLMWVLSFQISHVSLIWILFFLSVLTLFIRTYRRPERKKNHLFLLSCVFLVVFVKTISVISQTSSLKQVEENGLWKTYSPELIQELESQNKAYFIDFTAAWCLTCQVNKKLVLNTDNIQSQFKEKEVVLLKADWTNQDPVITKALEKLNRNSVPVYVLYIPSEKKEYILPEILTVDVVESALAKL